MKSLKSAIVQNAIVKDAHIEKHTEECHELTAVWVYVLTYQNNISRIVRRQIIFISAFYSVLETLANINTRL